MKHTKIDVTIGGRIVTNPDEITANGINLTDVNKPLISSNIDKSISIKQVHRGLVFKGNVNDILAALTAQKNDVDSDDEQRAENTPKF